MRGVAGALAVCMAVGATCAGEPTTADTRYPPEVASILEQKCFDCHGGGGEEGGVSLDPGESGAGLLKDASLWARALRSVRAGIMPPDGWDRPTAEERELLAEWVKRSVFEIDYNDPDPGKVTLRRLNRTEYRNTVRDLMGVDYEVEFHFPPDDTGYGFDNIGDALSLSPLLVEKYLNAATEIVNRAAPMTSLESPVTTLRGHDFTAGEDRASGRSLDLSEEATVRATFDAPVAGEYRVEVAVKRVASFEYNSGRANVAFLIDGEQKHEAEHFWEEDTEFTNTHEVSWEPGSHELVFDVQPLPASGKEPARSGELSLIPEEGFARLEVRSVRIVGPLGDEHRVMPPGYKRFYSRVSPPEDPEERRVYAREVLTRFTRKASRRPAPAETIDRLVAIAEARYSENGETFERGVADAMTAALASSQFLFHHESPDPHDTDSRYPRVDDDTLAERLSYFLWATAPDDELRRLADEGRLAEETPAQVDRLLRDDRSQAMLRHFVGQWLRAKDVEHVPLDTLAILRLDKEFDELLQKLRERGFRRLPDGEPDPLRDRFLEIREQSMVLDHGLRSSMRREVEQHFEYVVREDRSLLELVDCDYVFVNDKLADYYGLPPVEGGRLRRVELPEGSVRGGVLTAGATLLVTSNPTRTSPVKRGLFILDNLLGTPPPPPPPNVPELEDATDKFGDREPSLRELLAAHRDSPLCSSCHQRMDPLGLAMENFNALGQWRETDGDAAIEPAGRLISGEEFANLPELKRVLVESRRLDFYRCLTQKFFTFALGRGVEPADQHTIDQIVQRLDAEGGRFSVLLEGVVQSPAFLRMRRPQKVVAGQPAESQTAIVGAAPAIR